MHDTSIKQSCYIKFSAIQRYGLFLFTLNNQHGVHPRLPAQICAYSSFLNFDLHKGRPVPANSGRLFEQFNFFHLTDTPT